MLHTLNKSWLKILVNQSIDDADKRFLIVTTNDTERFDAIDTLWSVLPKDVKTVYIQVMTTDDLKREILSCIYYKEEFPVYDDILISHTFQDIFMRSFLCQHCKRKG